MTEKQTITRAHLDQRVTELDEARWWDASPNSLHEGLSRLVTWMASGDATADELVDVIAKPWNFTDQLAAAQLELDPDTWEEDLAIRSV